MTKTKNAILKHEPVVTLTVADASLIRDIVKDYRHILRGLSELGIPAPSDKSLASVEALGALNRALKDFS